MASAQNLALGPFLLAREERDSPGLRTCVVMPAWPLSCGQVSARNERFHVDLNRVASLSKLVWHGPADMPHAPRRWGRAPTRRNIMPEPSKQVIEARAYQLWEKAGCPKDREDEFWHLAQQELRNEDKSSPTRTPDAL